MISNKYLNSILDWNNEKHNQSDAFYIGIDTIDALVKEFGEDGTSYVKHTLLKDYDKRIFISIYDDGIIETSKSDRK